MLTITPSMLWNHGCALGLACPTYKKNSTLAPFGNLRFPLGPWGHSTVRSDMVNLQKCVF